MTTDTKTLFVPSLASTSHYIPRTFSGNVGEFETFDYALENNLNVLIEGETGTGKTSGVMAYCAQRHLNFFAVPCNSAIDFTQVIGGLFPNAEGKLEWVDGGITRIVREGGVLLINELNNAPKNLSQYLMSLLDDRRSITLMGHGNEVVTAHKDLLIVADQNPNYRGTQLLNEAWKDRFEIKLRYNYDNAIEKKIVTSSALLELANGIRSTSRQNDYASDRGTIFETPVSPRLLKTFEKIARDLSYDFAVDNFVNNFTDEERPAVKMLIEGASYNIKEELGLAVDSINTEYANA
jgi:MoxR-like ATPase